MNYSESFYKSTARDYDMSVDDIKYIARGAKGDEDIYELLEKEIQYRGEKWNKN